MQPALRSSIPDASLAVFPVNGENSHQGLAGANPAPNPVREVCKFTVLLGLQSATLPSRARSRSTGKERDTESGNDYFGARYFANNMGRWFSPDWSAKVEPVPYSKLDDPQSLNLYAYVENNPMMRVDPDGHCCLDDDIVALSTLAGGVGGTYFGADVGGIAGTAVEPGGGTIAGGIEGSIIGGSVGASLGRKLGQKLVNVLNSKDVSAKGPVKGADSPTVTSNGQAATSSGEVKGGSGDARGHSTRHNTEKKAKERAGRESKDGTTRKDANPADGRGGHYHPGDTDRSASDHHYYPKKK